MGSLILPPSGLVYVDAPILIYSVEAHPTYGPLVASLWHAARSGAIEVVSSELALAEVLILPLRLGDLDLQSDFERALLGTEMRLIPIDLPILRQAARLRAAIPALRTPDALHAATAIVSGASLFLTNHVGFRRVPGLPLVLLNDVARP